MTALITQTWEIIVKNITEQKRQIDVFKNKTYSGCWFRPTECMADICTNLHKCTSQRGETGGRILLPDHDPKQFGDIYRIVSHLSNTNFHIQWKDLS